MLLPLSWLVSMIFAAFVHEAGHVIAVWAVGAKVDSISLTPFGAKIYTTAMEDHDVFYCALAGPAAGLMLCFFVRWIPITAVFAGIQSVFNLLPIYPLDGGRALQAAKRIRKGKSSCKSP